MGMALGVHKVISGKREHRLTWSSAVRVLVAIAGSLACTCKRKNQV